MVDLSPSVSALGWPVEHRDRPAVRAVREAATAAMSAACWEHAPSR
ncbi:hypothetical protein [Streptomyces sp. NPDC048825]